MKARFRSRFGNRTAAIVTAVLLVLGGFGGAAIAVTVGAGTLGNFEQDGNFAVNTPGHLDWANVSPTITNDDTADSGFTQGSKELQPSSWVCGTGGASPDKGNILRAYVDSRLTANKAYVDLAWIRQGVSGGGDVHLNFEFSQHGTAQAPASFTPGPCPIDRASGDLLVTYDFPGGSSDPDIKAFKWAAGNAGGNEGSWIDQNLPASAAKAAVNQVSVADPFDGTIDPGRFGEATIDLLAAIPPDPNGHCTTFGYMNVRSRSSGESITSALQDKLPTTAIDLSTCGKIIVHKTDDHVPPHALAGAVFGLYKDSPNGAPIAQATSQADGSATFDTIDPGTYFVKELSAPSTDYTFDPNHVVGPIVVGFKETKDMTDQADIFVNPRKTGTLHITKLVNDGNGHAITPLNLAGLDGTTFLVFKDANSNGTYDAGEGAKLWPAETQAAQCTISGGLGYCNVGPLPTGTYGVHEVTAPAGTQAGSDIFPVAILTSGQTVNVPFTNTVRVSARLSLTPAEAANQVGHTHTFTAHLELDHGDGAGFVNAPAGETINFTKVSGPGSLSSGSCTTNASGICTVDLNSAVTGLTTVRANWSGNVTTAVGPAPASTTSNDAVKQWTNAHLTLNPPAAANQVGATHTFTAHLTYDYGDGKGFVDAPSGETVHLTKVSGPGALSAGNCTTNTSGECTVDLTSSVTGLTTVDASWNGHIATSSGSASASAASNDALKRWTNAHLTLTPPKAANQVNNKHTFTAHLTLDHGDGNGFVNAPAGETVDMNLVSGPGALSAGSCDTNAGGQCTIDLNSSATGLSTVDASWNGQIATAQGAASASVSSSDAVKRWVDAALTLTPPTAVNRVGDVHVFTAHLTYNYGVGNGFVDAPAGETIDITKVSGPGTLSASSCNTSASGTCTVNLNSSVTGTTDVHAEWNGKIATAEGDAVASTHNDAEKIWVNALMIINPPTATNEIGHDHVFTIDVSQIVNGVTSAAANVDVTASITSGPGSFVGNNTCTTNVSGECTVTINSPTTGLTTVQAAATVSVNGKSINLVTDGQGGNAPPAIKRWVNARLSVNPPEATNVLNHVHVFTAHLELDFGDAKGFVDAPAGETITWAKNSGVGTMSSTSCTTNASGECTDNLNSLVPGNTEVKATWAGVMTTVEGTASLTRNATALKHWVSHPAINVVKGGATLAHAGDKVTYTFVVKNTGDVDLFNVTVKDDKIGDIGTLASLAVGATTNLTKDAIVPAGVNGVTNIVTACGTDTGQTTVCDTDPHTLIVIHPNIQIVKTASPTTAEPGQTVTYTYTVTNVGDTTLNHVVVSDDVIGDIGTIASLDPNETKVLTKTFTVAADSPRTNIGQACGTDVLSLTVCDTDPATISIVLPIPPQARLPKTGMEMLLWTAFGMVLLAAGLAMMKTRRYYLPE